MKDWFWSGAGFHTLRAACSILQGTLALPEVVIDELLPNYREALTKALHGLRQVIREPLDLSERIELEYQKYLSFLGEQKQLITILPYPRVPHKEIVHRIYMEKRPFRKVEKGYKDYLIWRSITELLEGEGAADPSLKVVFISANTNDFARAKDETPLRLHDDFLHDLPLEMHGRVTYYGSTETFCRSVIGDGFADFVRNHPDAANLLRITCLPTILNTFLAQNRPQRRYVTYEAKDLSFTLSYVQSIPEGLYTVSGIMDFTPWWHTSMEGEQLGSQNAGRDPGLVGTNNWDAHVTLIVDRELHVLKADIDGESIRL
jgi:PIN domain